VIKTGQFGPRIDAGDMVKRTSIITAMSVATIGGLASCASRALYHDPVPVATLAQCEVAHVDTAGWQVANVADVGLHFRYPRNYQRQNLSGRHIPLHSEDAWYRDGRPEYVLSVRMVESVRADIEISEWGYYPQHRECAAAFAAKETPPARVIFHAGGNVLNNYDKEYPPYTIVAEWRFSGGRVVRLVGSGPDSASQREHLAVVQTAYFTHAPPFPVR
jgi:hypothetical protein